MKIQAVNDCFAVGANRLSHEEALNAIRSSVRPVVDPEPATLAESSGRFIAEEIAAPTAVPPHTNSAVDGFAFAYAAYNQAMGAELELLGRATAGHALNAVMPTTACARIFTGAVMPEGTDTVAMQEDCVANDNRISIPAGLKSGANVRRAGEDHKAGVKLFKVGDLLRPQDLAALAAIGKSRVSCFRRLRVAVVASGDEIIAAGSDSACVGQVYDTNTPMLQALLSASSATVESLGIWLDNRAAISERLSNASVDFDAIITTGGASQGDEDHMAAALGDLGIRHFWQIAVKPGRPMMLGQIDRRTSDEQPCVVVGLPGNPVAVFVCTLMYVLPLLRLMSGGHWLEPRRYKLPAAFAFTGRKRGRREFWRGMYVDTETGTAIDKFTRDGSGLISGLRAADGLIDVAEDAGDVAVGDPIDFIPLTEFGIFR